MKKTIVKKKSSHAYEYTNLCAITEPSDKINVYGVIQSVVKEPSLTTNNKMQAIVNIIDESVSVPFRVSLFYEPSDANATLELKENYIIRFHRLKVEPFNGMLDGRVFKLTDVLLFHPTDEGLSDDELICWCVAKTYNFVDSDAARVRELIKWWHESTATDSIDPFFVSAVNKPMKFVLTCKVLKVSVLDNKNTLVLTATDGTRCPLKLKKIFTENSVDSALSNQGCFQKDLFDVDIIIINASDDLKRLQEGQFVKLGFVQVKHPTEGNRDNYIFILDWTDSFIRIFPQNHIEAQTLMQRIVTNCLVNADNRLVRLINGEHAYSLTGSGGNFAPEDSEMSEPPTDEPVARCDNISTSLPNVPSKQLVLKLGSHNKPPAKNSSRSCFKSSTQNHEFSHYEDSVATTSGINDISKQKIKSEEKCNSLIKVNKMHIIPELSPIRPEKRSIIKPFQNAKRKVFIDYNDDEDEEDNENESERIFGQLFGSEEAQKINSSVDKEIAFEFQDAGVVSSCENQAGRSYEEMEVYENTDAEGFPCSCLNVRSMHHNHNYFQIKGWIRHIGPFDLNKKEDFVSGYCKECHKFKPYSAIKNSILNGSKILCTTCGPTGIESELKLVFHFHLLVIDEFNQIFKLVALTKAAEKLFGCSVEDYLQVPWLQCNVFNYLSKTLTIYEKSKKDLNAYSFIVLPLKEKIYILDIGHKPLI